MQVYRITKAQYATRLQASGLENRWNSAGKFVVYTAGSAALACLENLVHTSGQLLHTEPYRLMIVEIGEASMMKVELKDLPKDWQEYDRVRDLQAIGNGWYDDGKSLVMRVPSVIIPSENNYLINTRHPDFIKIKIGGALPFLFDKRLKPA